MRILALETSSRSASIAILREEETLRQIQLSDAKRTAQSLAPAISDLLKQADWKPAEIDLVAVTIGPGSFTGLRVGVTTAKTLAYAVKAEVKAVNTLDVVASQTPTSTGQFVVVMDAMRGEYFRKEFRRTQSHALETLQETQIVDLEVLTSEVDSATAITGPATEKLARELGGDRLTVEAAFRDPQAATVGRLAWAEYQQGKRDELWSLAPAYYRKSAAEEKLL